MVYITFSKLKVNGRHCCVVGSDLVNYQGVWISNRTQQLHGSLGIRRYAGSDSSNTTLRIGMPSRPRLSVTVVWRF